jgi:tRNA 2-selenouridine synthase
MVRIVDIEQIAGLLQTIPVVDVRSPGEFQKGHIPGAHNLPVFDDEERAIVGTMYKKSGREAAVLSGLEFIGPKMAGMAKKGRALAKEKELLMYCWRGGMRSAAMAWLFDMAGLNVTLIKEGYKAYRKYIRQDFEENARIAIIGGMTGSGKTLLLNALKDEGKQVIDLEFLASHKGSVFGSLGQPKQPTNEQFENDLHNEWMRLDHSELIWIEDESQSIGYNRVPDALFSTMMKSPLLILEVNKEERIRRLEQEYAGYDAQHLKDAVIHISKRLGGNTARMILDAIDRRDFRVAVGSILTYYDKTYRFSIESRKEQPKFYISFDSKEPAECAKRIVDFYHKSVKPFI